MRNTKSVDVRPSCHNVSTQFPEKRISMKSKGVQFERATAEVSTSTDDLEMETEIDNFANELLSGFILEDLNEISRDVILDCTSEAESSFNDPDESFIVESDDEYVHEVKQLPSSSSAFVVFWGQLLVLLQHCVMCGHLAHITGYFFNGSMIGINLICTKFGHKFTWRSQPLVRGIAVGNLKLASAILFSGNTYTRFKEIFKFASIRYFEKDTFNRYQNRYLFGIVNEAWLNERHKVLSGALRKKQINVIGDGRCDSPGHNAKYLTYSMQNQETKEVVSVNVVQVTEAGNSNRMELVGFKKALADVERDINVKQVTTDRHTQVRKYMLENEKDKVYQNDVWHVVKSVLKKLRKLTSKKQYALLSKWNRSICNHLWWSSATCEGSYEILKEKWVSILQHVKNRHSWGGNKFVHKCSHPKLTNSKERKTKWMKASSPSYKALQDIVLDKKLLKDLRYLTNFDHTGSTEVYNALLNKYCPKSIHFSYEGMVSRCQLAALDHNSGAMLPQATTRMGVARWNVAFPKHSKSWVVKPIKAAKDKAYVHNMVDRVVEAAKNDDTLVRATVPNVPPNIASTPKPEKASIIAGHRSRFNHS